MKNMLSYVIILMGSMILVSCGGSNSESTNDKNSQSFSVPKKIDLETPKGLKQSKNNPNNYSSDAYGELKDFIYALEQTKKSLKISVLLISKLTDEISNRCESFSLNNTCTIGENELSFTYDEKMIEEMIEIKGEEFRTQMILLKDKKIPLNKVAFTQYNSNEKYQYLLDVEYVPNVESLTQSVLSIKWSKDEKNIVSYYSTSFSQGAWDMTLYLEEKEEGKREMNIQNNLTFKTEDFNTKAKVFFKLIEKGDKDESFDVSYLGDYNFTNNGIDSKQKNSFIGTISDKGGSILSEEEGRKERSNFNEKGELTLSIYCDTSSSCDLKDESTWLPSERNNLGGEASPVPISEPTSFQ